MKKEDTDYLHAVFARGNYAVAFDLRPPVPPARQWTCYACSFNGGQDLRVDHERVSTHSIKHLERAE